MSHCRVSLWWLAPSHVLTSIQEDHPDPNGADETMPGNCAMRERLLWHCSCTSSYSILVEHPGGVPVPAKDVSWRATTHHSSV